MKYGIDINRNNILIKIKEGIITRGHWVVDLTKEKAVKKGDLVFKKALLANITEIDYYIGVEFSDSISELQIYWGDNIDVKKIYEEMKNMLYEKDKIIINEDIKELYLVKNINAPAIYIRIPCKYEEKFNYEYLDKFTNLILNI